MAKGVKTGGRRKGTPNRDNKALKEMILGALSQAGGEQYLYEQALNNPGAFMQLIGKVLPTELKQQVEGGISVTISTGVPLDDAE